MENIIDYDKEIQRLKIEWVDALIKNGYSAMPEVLQLEAQLLSLKDLYKSDDLIHFYIMEGNNLKLIAWAESGYPYNEIKALSPQVKPKDTSFQFRLMVKEEDVVLPEVFKIDGTDEEKIEFLRRKLKLKAVNSIIKLDPPLDLMARIDSLPKFINDSYLTTIFYYAQKHEFKLEERARIREVPSGYNLSYTGNDGIIKGGYNKIVERKDVLPNILEN